MRRTSLLAGSVAVWLALFGAGCGDDETAGGGGSGGTGAGDNGGGGAGGGGAPPSGPAIEGLDGEVTATYDQNGILHLACESDADCYAAMGYFHAQNRFFFMDFVRNLVRGKLGSLVAAGDTVLEQDYENRRFFTTRDGQPLEEKLAADASPEVRGYIDAYTRGVNAWIADMRAEQNGATLTVEYDFALIVKENIRDWEPEDSAAIGLYVLNDLSNNSGSEIAMGGALPLYPPALAADLFSARPVYDAFTLPLAQQGAQAAPPAWHGSFDAEVVQALLSDAQSRLARVGSGASVKRPLETGSNNWIVGPDRTSSGNALLANDPHLLLTNPSIWFPIELDAKTNGGGTFHVAGSAFPGLPSIMVGHNEDVAWGVTTAYWDLTDVYVEELSEDGQSVLFNGEEVAIEEHDFIFADASSGGTITKTFRYVPHHGPIVSEDLDAGTAITIRWRGHDGGTDLDAFFGVAKAGSVAEAREAITNASSANQNFVVVDKDGGMGWYPFSKVPGRPWATAALAPWMPLPGDGSAEWDDFVPFDELPQATDPAGGALATANQDMTGANADGDLLNDGQDALQAYSKAEGTRQQRILDLLEDGGDSHSVDTMVDIQGDTSSLYGRDLVPAFLAAAQTAKLSPAAQDVVDALEAWDFTCPTGLDGTDPETAGVSTDANEVTASIGCTAFHAVLYATVRAALGDEIAATGAPLSGGWDMHLVVRALRDPSSISSGDLLWDDVSTDAVVETRDQILVRGLELATAGLSEVGAPDEWQWGRVHTLTLRSIFDNFGLVTYNEGPFAASGGQYTVNVANPRSRAVPDEGDPWNFEFGSGASVRFVAEAHPDGPRMVYQLPGGADLHRESDFYNNLLPNWLANEPIEFPFGPGAVTDPALEIVVSPAP